MQHINFEYEVDLRFQEIGKQLYHCVLRNCLLHFDEKDNAREIQKNILEQT